MQEPHRDVELALHAAGPGPDQPAGGRGKPETVQQLGRRGPQLGAAQPVQVALQEEVLPAAGLQVDRVLLEHAADRPADRVRVPVDVVAGDDRGARVALVSVVRILTVVDLPAPFGPSSPNTVPAGTARLTPRTASTPPG